MTEFEEFLQSEINKYKGANFPRKASFLRRILCRKVSIKKIHPNPEDEFCDPKIGPNYGIISNYDSELRHKINMSLTPKFDEPLMVERMYPDGYMLLNGHHRGAAFCRNHVKSVPVQIVNCTHKYEIEKMLKNAKHDKRVTLDLDEVIFVNEADGPAEKPISFPLARKIYKERLKYGIPKLFHYLRTNGYDIWVYTSKLYSMEYILQLLFWYHIKIDGLVTGMSVNRTKKEDHIKTKNAISKKYPHTIHIDQKMMVSSNSMTKEYEIFNLTGSPDTWSQEILNIISRLDSENI